MQSTVETATDVMIRETGEPTTSTAVTADAMDGDKIALARLTRGSLLRVDW